MAHEIPPEVRTAMAWHGLDEQRERVEAAREKAYRALLDAGFNSAQALAVVVNNSKRCDACGHGYDVSPEEITSDEFSKCCPSCVLGDVVQNGDISQRVARAMLRALSDETLKEYTEPADETSAR